VATTVGTLKSILTLDASGFGKGIGRALKDVNRFQRTVGSITKTLSFFTGAFGVTLGATALFRGQLRRMDTIRDLAEQAERTGVSLKSLGVDLEANGVRRVVQAQRAVDSLKTSWRQLADTIVSGVAPALRTASEGLMQIFEPPQVPPKATPKKKPFEIAQDAAEARLKDLRGTIQSAKAAQDVGATINAARRRKSNERADEMADAEQRRKDQQRSNELRRNEISATREMIRTGGSLSDDAITEMLLGGNAPQMAIPPNPRTPVIPQRLTPDERIGRELLKASQESLEELKKLNAKQDEERRRQGLPPLSIN
jgi:hypothetical protein